MLVLLRHGEAVGNAEGRLLGRMDSPLTERGRTQAKRLADLLDTEAGISRVITSPLSRARGTAEALGLDVRIETDERWAEVDYGSYDGERLSGVPSEVWRAWRADRDTGRPAERHWRSSERGSARRARSSSHKTGWVQGRSPT